MVSLGALRIMCVLVTLPACARGQDQGTVMVFAAGGTALAIERIVDLYERHKGGRVVVSFAAASTLARQIDAGAPADIIVSASDEWMDWLDDRGLVEASSRRVLAGNRLVLIASAGSGMKVSIGPRMDLSSLLEGGRLATGDPDHVPVGRYARAALENLGAWDGIEDHLARTQTTRAALVLVERGEAPLGIVYASDASSSDKVEVLGTFDASTHPPIVFSAAIVKRRGTEAVENFFGFLAGEQAKAVFEDEGFVVE